MRHDVCRTDLLLDVEAAVFALAEAGVVCALHGVLGDSHTPAAAAASLPAFPARLARFVGRPLMCGALLVGRTSGLAGDLALPLRCHRSKPLPSLPCRLHGESPLQVYQKLAL